MTDSQAAPLTAGTGARDWRYRCIDPDCRSVCLELYPVRGGWYCRGCKTFATQRWDSKRECVDTHPKGAGAPAQDTAPVRQRGEADD